MKQPKENETSIKEELLFLVLKIVIFGAVLAVMFLVLFGISRVSDQMMYPAFRDGDLVVYYRLQKEFQPLDSIVLEKDGETQVRRIVACTGDEVNLTEEGLEINGSLQQESNIYAETLPYKEGITFPITVGDDEYFVLGDNRTTAKDSRLYGLVKKEEVKGIVITLLRRRGF